MRLSAAAGGAWRDQPGPRSIPSCGRLRRVLIGPTSACASVPCRMISVSCKRGSSPASRHHGPETGPPATSSEAQATAGAPAQDAARRRRARFRRRTRRQHYHLPAAVDSLTPSSRRRNYRTRTPARGEPDTTALTVAGWRHRTSRLLHESLESPDLLLQIGQCARELRQRERIGTLDVF